MGEIIIRKVRGMSWTSKISLVLIFTLVFSTFMYQGWYKPKASESAPTANGRIVYSINTTAPQSRAYTASTNTFAAAAAMQTGVAQTFMVDRAAPTRNEHMAGYVTTGGVLYIFKWDGASWIEVTNTAAPGGWGVGTRPTVGGNGVDGRRFDIEYENTSGDAMVVYSTGTNGSAGAEMAYRIWNGSTWTAAANLPNSARLAQAAAVTSIKLASRPGSDEIAVMAADSGTTTANTALFTAFIWNGTAWGNEPTSTFGTTYNTTGQLFQNDLFDLAYESVSGDLFTVFTTATPQQNYRTYSAGTWGTVTSYATGRAAPLQMVAVSNPNTDQILVVFNRSASTNVYGRIWSGTADGNAATIGANGVTTAANKKHITAKWLNVGGTDYGVVVWQANVVTPDLGTKGYNYFSGAAWGTAATYNPGVDSNASWMDTVRDPQGSDTMMLTYSDGNSDLWAKRLVLSAGPTFTWTNADGGAALTTLLGSITSQNFSFAYDRYNPADSVNVADGTDPANYNAGRGSTNNVADSFTMVSTNTIDGLAAVTGVTASLTNSANISGIRLYKDNGVVGTYEAGTDTLLSTGTPGASVNFTGFTENLTTTTTNYLILVDISGSATLAQTIDTSVTAVTVTAPDTQGTISDASNPTRLTVVDLPHENVGTALNTAIATSPKTEGASGVLMQRFQVTSSTSGAGAQDNQLELNSLGIDDLGTATGARTAKAYIDTTSSATLPGTAVLIGSVSSWTGTPTSITLNQGTAGDRTVANGTPKYIYIVYDLPSGATQTVQSSITSVGVVSPDAGQTGLTLNSNAITLNADPSKITSCGGCHAYPPTDGTRSGATGAFVGSHQAHNVVCLTCHVAPATETSADYAHRNGQINMKVGATAISNGYYDKDASNSYSAADATFAQSNTPTTATCKTIACHGGSNTPQWGVGTVTCSTCHSSAMDAGDGAPTRRAVFGEFQNNSIGHMQYNVSAAANATVKADCTKCHAESTSLHANNTLDNGRTGNPGGATIAQPPVAAFCLDCHKSGATNNSFSTQSRTSPNIDGSGWTTGTTAKSGTGNVIGMQSHRVAAAGGCADCHGDGAGNARVHGGTVNNLMLRATQYQTCFNGTSTACHGSSSTITNTGARIQLAASVTGGMHPIFGAAVTPKSATLRRATLGTTTATDGGDDLLIRGWLPSSTMVCSDCHSQNGTTGVRGPHGSAYTYILKGYDNTAVTTATSGRTLGTPYVSGVLTLDANNQENICLNCHAADIYGDGNGGAIANSTISDAGHTTSWTNSGTARCGGSANEGTNTALINCLNCHGGSNPAGGYGAHGSSRAPAAAGLEFGGGGSGYFTRGAGLINGDSWTQAPDATNGCYALGTANNWSACSQGSHN